VVSPQILAEYNETIEELAARYPGRKQVAWVESLTAAGDLVFPIERARGLIGDPDDEMFLERALIRLRWLPPRALVRASAFAERFSATSQSDVAGPLKGGDAFSGCLRGWCPHLTGSGSPSREESGSFVPLRDRTPKTWQDAQASSHFVLVWIYTRFSALPVPYSGFRQGGHLFVGAKTACDGSREFWYGSRYGSDLKNPQCLCGLVRMYGSRRGKGGG
jgi:hypothetical protein